MQTAFSKRDFLRASASIAAIAVASAYARRALAIAPMVPIIVPSLLAGLFGVLMMKEQAEQSSRQHAEQMRLSAAGHRLALEQMRASARQSERGELVSILTTLLGRDERFAQTLLANSPVLQSLAFDKSGRLSAVGLSNNVDGHGSLLGIQHGELIVERGGRGGVITPQEGADVPRNIASGEPIPIPVSAPIELGFKESRKVKERIASEKRMPIETFEKTSSIMSVRKYSRGRRPTLDGADLASVAVVSRIPDARGYAPIEFIYLPIG